MTPPLYLTASQVSSRELAGKKLQGYDKRDITYEVHTVCLAKLFVTDILRIYRMKMLGRYVCL